MKRPFFAALLLIPTLAIAADDLGKPTSPPALAAIQKHDDALVAARKAYQKAQVDAEQQEVDELDKALGIAMQAKSLVEANRINAVKEEAAKHKVELLADSKPTMPTQKTTDTLTPFFAGTTWRHQGGGILTYAKDHTIACTHWSGSGHWKAVDDRTVIEEEPNGNTFLITISSDKKAALWEGQDGHLETSKLIAAP